MPSRAAVTQLKVSPMCPAPHFKSLALEKDQRKTPQRICTLLVYIFIYIYIHNVPKLLLSQSRVTLQKLCDSTTASHSVASPLHPTISSLHKSDYLQYKSTYF